MSLFPSDVILKECISLGLEDLRKNTWICDDIFSDFVSNPLLSTKYGQKEIQNAKDFLLNNKINVMMAHVMTTEVFPLVSIAVGSSNEDKSLATLGDLDVEVVDYDPADIGKPIAWVIPPFNMVSFVASTGVVTLPVVPEFKYLNVGMILVDVETGNAWAITEVLAGNQIKIAINSDLGDASKFGIAPKYRGYRARRERIISQENCSIGCHVAGDPATLLFLFAFVKYSLLRYREGLLEHNGFQLSNLNCSEMVKNNSFDVENVYSRFITLSGQVEESWVKGPERVIEAIDIYDSVNQTTGIKIMSQDPAAGSEELLNDLWTTITPTIP